MGKSRLICHKEHKDKLETNFGSPIIGENILKRTDHKRLMPRKYHKVVADDQHEA